MQHTKQQRVIVTYCRTSLLCTSLYNITSVKQMVFGEGHAATIPELLILVWIFTTRDSRVPMYIYIVL